MPLATACGSGNRGFLDEFSAKRFRGLIGHEPLSAKAAGHVRSTYQISARRFGTSLLFKKSLNSLK